MNIQEMNEKYISLCSRFSIPICISTIDDSEAPAQAISDNGAVSTITLNTKKIADTDYEMYLAYNIGKVLLPRLVLETERLILRTVPNRRYRRLFWFYVRCRGLLHGLLQTIYRNG